jgi:membrane-bound lytic murein transglycosylase MltF
LSGTLPPSGRGLPPGLLVLLLLVVWPVPLAGQRHLDRYDETFRKYSKRFFGAAYDWRVFKAQGLAESNLNPRATSWVGARGIMQLMPSTFLAIQSQNPLFASIDDDEWNIAAGVYHDRQLWRLWRQDSVESASHHQFMFASYNAGRVPILRAQILAQRRALDPRVWASIELVAPQVRRWRHRETLGYVRKIEANLSRMDMRGRLVRAGPSP